MSNPLVWTIAIGLAIGSISRIVNRGVDSMGLILSALVASGGALAATYGGHLCGLYRPGDPEAFAAALVGAIMMVFFVRISQPERAS